MGLLRLVLAFSVVVGHLNIAFPNDRFFHIFLINASSAVICFFTVSGFYMAYVINEKYKFVDHWQKKFLINRCLRLYPTYFFFLILCLVFQIYFRVPNFLTGLKDMGAAHRALNAFLNFSIVGQDIYVMFLETKGIDPLRVMPIAQAWSIAVELELYVVAGFLFATRFGLLTTLCIGVVLRLVMQYFGLIVPPIGHMFIFNVLIFFAFGGCAYILYKRIEAWPVIARAAIAGFLTTALLAYTWHYDGFWEIEARGDDYHCTLFYLGLALAIPFIFSLSRKSRLDNFLGNLSYPVYLCHGLVVNVLSHAYANSKFISKFLPSWDTLLTFTIHDIILVFFVSYLAYKWVEEPIQRVRTKLVLNK